MIHSTIMTLPLLYSYVHSLNIVILYAPQSRCWSQDLSILCNCYKKTFIATAADIVECIVKMTATNSGLNTTMVLVLLCLGIIFVGGWYFQSSLVEQRIKVEVQAEKIQQLNNQLDLLQMQHQLIVS